MQPNEIKRAKLLLHLREHAEVEIYHTPETTEIEGNVMASGDDAADRQAELDVRTKAQSNTWAWCQVEVRASFDGVEGADYLGCCSYESEEDFRNGGYFDDMREQALDALVTELLDRQRTIDDVLETEWAEHDADDFVQGYLAAALWAGLDLSDVGEDELRTLDQRAETWDSDSVVTAIMVCDDFRRLAGENLLSQAGDDSQNGHDFYLTRNGHGTGFWDRGYPDDVGERLTKHARTFGETHEETYPDPEDETERLARFIN